MSWWAFFLLSPFILIWGYAIGRLGSRAEVWLERERGKERRAGLLESLYATIRSQIELMDCLMAVSTPPQRKSLEAACLEAREALQACREEYEACYGQEAFKGLCGRLEGGG